MIERYSDSKCAVIPPTAPRNDTKEKQRSVIVDTSNRDQAVKPLCTTASVSTQETSQCPGSIFLSTSMVPAAPGESYATAKPWSNLLSVTKLVVSSIWLKRHKPRGVAMDKELDKAVLDEAGKDKQNGTGSKRRIDLEIMGSMLWQLLTFVYMSRWLRARAKALVQCLFHVLVVKYPEYFWEPLLKESRVFLKREVFQPWKFHKAIDLVAT